MPTYSPINLRSLPSFAQTPLLSASQRGGCDEPPVAMRPREFALVWRYNGALACCF